MHETGIVKNMIRRLEALAQEAGAERISRVQVQLGALSQFSPEHFREHFDDEAAGTLAEGAALVITVSEDPGDPHAQDVMVQNVDLEIEDPRG